MAAAALIRNLVPGRATEDRHEDGFWHLLAAFGSSSGEARFDEYRAGRADFGLLVDDLDAVHARALASGGSSSPRPTTRP
jgi:hypothetical protein